MRGGADRFEAFDEAFDEPFDKHEEHDEHKEYEEREAKHGDGKGNGDGDEGGSAREAAGRGPGEPHDTDDGRGDGGRGDSAGGGGGSGDGGGPSGPGQPPRIPMPRSSVEDTGLPLPEPSPLVLEHRVLKSLLGAWALAACSAQETEAVEEHLGECGACADEALRLREAVGLLHRQESLDLDPTLRTRVLEGCLDRRPPRIPVPEWAAPYDAETARLDALLQDIGDAEWHAPVRLRWFEGDGPVSRRTTVAGVIAHLLTVDGLVGVALGLEDPLGGAMTGAIGKTAPTAESATTAGGVLPDATTPRGAPRRTGVPRTSRPHGPCARPGGSRATTSSVRCRSRAGAPGGSPCRTAASNCRSATRCWTAPSSAGCTPGTSRTPWTIRTSRPRRVICTG